MMDLAGSGEAGGSLRRALRRTGYALVRFYELFSCAVPEGAGRGSDQSRRVSTPCCVRDPVPPLCVPARL